MAKQTSQKPVAVCQGGWDPEDRQRISLEDDDGLIFYLFVGDLPIDCKAPHMHLPHELVSGISFPVLVNATDVVIAKPGYGIASECLLHQTPAGFIDRPNFRETPLLLEEFSKRGRCVQLSLPGFFSGSWKHAIEKALINDSPWQTPPSDGAALVAESLACYLHL